MSINTEIPTFEKTLYLSTQLSLVDQLRLIESLVARVYIQQEQKSAPVDMLSLVGLGADLWQQIDVNDYLEKERAGWEH